MNYQYLSSFILYTSDFLFYLFLIRELGIGHWALGIKGQIVLIINNTSNLEID